MDTSDTSAHPLTRLEWTSTLVGLGLITCAAVLLESAPCGDYAQIMLILGAAMAVSVVCMAFVRTLSRKGRARSVPLEPEVNTNGYARI